MSLTYKLKKFAQTPTMILFWSYAAMALGNLPVILLPIHADVPGPWWIIILAAYMTAVNSAYAMILWPREMARLRYVLGDEAFFLLYPKEWKREKRRLARRQRALEKRRVKHMRRHEPVV